MSRKINQYDISEELKNKIDKEYDEEFRSDKAKLGFTDNSKSSKDDPWIGVNAHSWNAALDAVIVELKKIEGNDSYIKAWKIAIEMVKGLKR